VQTAVAQTATEVLAVQVTMCQHLLAVQQPTRLAVVVAVV